MKDLWRTLATEKEPHVHYYPDELMALERAPGRITIPRPGIGLPLAVLAAAVAMAALILASTDEPMPSPVAPPTVVTSLVTQSTTAPAAPPATPVTTPTTAASVTPVESIPAINGGGRIPVIE